MRSFTLQINNIPCHVTTQINQTRNLTKEDIIQQKNKFGLFDLPGDFSLGNRHKLRRSNLLLELPSFSSDKIVVKQVPEPMLLFHLELVFLT